VKDEEQLIYYDSSFGTYVKPSAKFSRAWQRLLNIVDMAVALWVTNKFLKLGLIS
jgi:hypothetical protein